ncbi:NAD(P)-dependent oxidoreductase [Paractinoplanes abujensis]|uniref:NAD(P)H dehydrogenase (Quinone) n=1 Tax=Paractinoplanes abujensis TaxID=882441 RepID=A0A7W7G6I2_9ACTN|nr:NAD(P)H-binding protein [Actinoplanes abujensis]MBB4696011.1 NAD(P)H dehydrogenase (quinone) [Actinoplanes abujensis]GID21998.1 NAD(P)-dependent oxidoreductase [Actinoplanes abujensis]
MTIVVTGATGHLGRLTIQSLLAKGVPASEIVGLGRQTDKIADLGITVKQVAYEDPEALRAAFEGADKVLFISGSEAGNRLAQHTNVVAAAKAAQVGLLVYTSITKADTSDLKLAEEHAATEKLITESGLPYAFLRNSWYLENYDVAQGLEHGFFGAAADGRISAAKRADYAEAAAAVLTTDGQAGKIYELGGPGFTMAEFAAEVAEQSGRPVTYTDLGEDKYREMLVGVGLPEAFAAILADSDRGAANGGLYAPADDLESLLGRPATSLKTYVSEALKS